MKICKVEEIKDLIKEILKEVGSHGIILLKGDLAAGKTTFVKEFVKVLGIQVKVSSPTFSIMNEYEDSVCHYDIYQNGIDGFLQSGLFEKLDEPKYHLIEWADEKLEKILQKMGYDYMKIEIKTVNDKRGYICTHSK
ncbi:tRNA (adenosine(37)-N6)-threonylcarbamoyltransferase complex ATPase subunit type 1 TsaE [Sulfurospirillum arcachonense]|uniref:tRNA (adenosine(37)-N6)-threonylcarbamoyltransferase complex ATPase subunit type 1 TsaE n=1 Tax=Sulfurospirillum arcachonense TaxID=57666 RepID=UPI0004BB6DCC|nr:tRNA (adenosine(37)-N6)-threonylcarbamoyltransferase complex ATPase subunit type 1 TsaE [Sulfurospirillum arcachonense]